MYLILYKYCCLEEENRNIDLKREQRQCDAATPFSSIEKMWWAADLTVGKKAAPPSACLIESRLRSLEGISVISSVYMYIVSMCRCIYYEITLYSIIILWLIPAVLVATCDLIPTSPLHDVRIISRKGNFLPDYTLTTGETFWWVYESRSQRFLHCLYCILKPHGEF